MTAAPAQAAAPGTAVAIPRQCDKQTALNLTREIKRSVEQSWRLIKEAFERRAWAALDYESWESYCTGQLGTGLVRLSKALRLEAVAELTSGDQPMSNRAVAGAIGVSESTVRADRAAGARNRAPDPEAEVRKGEVSIEIPVEIEAIDAEVVETEVAFEVESCEESIENVRPLDSLRRVTGADGKSYTTNPETKRRRRSLADRFGEDAVKVGDCADRLVELAKDDRFGINRADLNKHYRQRLKETAEAISTVIDALAEAGNAG